jgi:CheY-like chemotaxis protein
VSEPVRRVLVVDDNGDLRTVLKLRLAASGYAVSEAANGRDAIAVQRRERADVLITDIFMPEGDGFEAIDAFRKEFPQTKIVVISGDSILAKQDYLSAAALIGVDATLRKPFETEVLLATLRCVCDAVPRPSGVDGGN